MLLGGIAMLSIDRILEISKDMGIAIREGTDGRHYIIDDTGQKIEFNTDMLMKTQNRMSVQEFELKFTDMGQLSTSDSVYSPSNGRNSPYCLEPIEIVETNVIAA